MRAVTNTSATSRWLLTCYCITWSNKCTLCTVNTHSAPFRLDSIGYRVYSVLLYNDKNDNGFFKAGKCAVILYYSPQTSHVSPKFAKIRYVVMYLTDEWSISPKADSQGNWSWWKTEIIFTENSFKIYITKFRNKSSLLYTLYVEAFLRFTEWLKYLSLLQQIKERQCTGSNFSSQ
jgi:hypothetical protein